jgi:hypothetical protein
MSQVTGEGSVLGLQRYEGLTDRDGLVNYIYFDNSGVYLMHQFTRSAELYLLTIFVPRLEV